MNENPMKTEAPLTIPPPDIRRARETYPELPDPEWEDEGGEDGKGCWFIDIRGMDIDHRRHCQPLVDALTAAAGGEWDHQIMVCTVIWLPGNPKAETDTESTATCGVCGYQWKRGSTGAHICSEHLRAQIDELRAALSGRTVSCAQCNERAKAKTHLMDRPWIGVDLDGTLAHYDEWRGIEHIGPPIEEMRLRVKQWLDEGQEVRILTARVGPQRHDVPHTIAEITRHIEAWCLEHLGQVLRVMSQKDYHMVAFWDDRCVQVVPNTGVSLAGKLADSENERIILGNDVYALKARIAEQDAQIVALREAIGAYAEFHGGCDHHPDDCPHEEEECKIVHALTKALSGKPPPVVSKEAEHELKAERLKWAEAEKDAEWLATALKKLMLCADPHIERCTDDELREAVEKGYALEIKEQAQAFLDVRQALAAHKARLEVALPTPAQDE